LWKRLIGIAVYCSLFFKLHPTASVHLKLELLARALGEKSGTYASQTADTFTFVTPLPVEVFQAR
jgi:hypothetical protein